RGQGSRPGGKDGAQVHHPRCPRLPGELQPRPPVVRGQRHREAAFRLPHRRQLLRLRAGATRQVPAVMKLTFSNLPALGWDLPAERIVDLAGLCEEAGFDRFAVADVPSHFDGVPIMTACLLRTRRLEVESLVTNPYPRSPAAIASAWATMANLSGGRAIMGIGGGVESASRVSVAPWGYERPHPMTA